MMLHFDIVKCTCFVVVTLTVVRAGLFFNKYTTRFCYNSPNVTITVSINVFTLLSSFYFQLKHYYLLTESMCLL